MTDFAFGMPDQPGTVFKSDAGRGVAEPPVRHDVRLRWRDDDGPRRGPGMAIINTNLGRFEGAALSLVRSNIGDDGAAFTWQAAGGQIELTVRWSFETTTGVWRRKDTLTNRGDAAFTVYRCQPRSHSSPRRATRSTARTAVGRPRTRALGRRCTRAC